MPHATGRPGRAAVPWAAVARVARVVAHGHRVVAALLGRRHGEAVIEPT